MLAPQSKEPSAAVERHGKKQSNEVPTVLDIRSFPERNAAYYEEYDIPVLTIQG